MLISSFELCLPLCWASAQDIRRKARPKFLSRKPRSFRILRNCSFFHPTPNSIISLPNMAPLSLMAYLQKKSCLVSKSHLSQQADATPGVGDSVMKILGASPYGRPSIYRQFFTDMVMSLTMPLLKINSYRLPRHTP